MVSQRVKEGMCLMYHAQEKIVNVPGSEITGQRGGIHNSVTRVVVKPTHMIGGYAQQSYGFNYYGTIGTNRDEFVIIRKMSKVDWLDTPNVDQPERARRLRPRWRPQNENPRADRNGAEPRQVHRVPHLLGHLQERVDQPRGHGIRLVQQRRDQARHRLSEGLGEPEALEGRLAAQEERQDRAAHRLRSGGCWRIFSPIPTCRKSTTTTSRSPSTTSTCRRRRSCTAFPTARPRSLITGERMEKIEWGPNWEEILGGEFAKRSQDYNFEGVQKDIYGQFENTFMMYLPRLCEHCLNPACVAACPSGAIYKREEDGIVLIDQDKCRGWRMCVSGCPYKKIYYNWSSGKSEKCIFCYPRIEAGQPTVCSETCVGRIRYLGVVLYDADRIEEAASVPNEQDLYEAQLGIFLDPNDPAVIEQARVDGDCRRLARGRAPFADLENGDGVEGRFPASPGIPHAADGLVRAAAVADSVGRRRRQDRPRRRDAGRAVAAHSAQISRKSADGGRRGAGRARRWNACLRCAPICAPRLSTASSTKTSPSESVSPLWRSRTCTR